MVNLVILFLIIVTVCVFALYIIKWYSRDSITVQDNFIQTKEFFKENPKLYEKYISDCSKDEDFNNVKTEVEKISSDVKLISDKINVLNNLEKIIEGVVKTKFEEEKILEETR